MTKPSTVALALGSGGARGYAHVGALQVLDEAGIRVVGAAGSSMGALVGGLFAAGCLDEYMAWAVRLSRFDVVRLLDPARSGPGMIRAEKVFANVRELVGERLIEDLPIPYTAVATDLLARKEVWFQQGPLAAAIRASIAIPAVLTPIAVDGRLLVDGGVLNPVPVAPVSAVRADATLAIDLNGESRTEAPAPRERTERWMSRLLARFSGDHAGEGPPAPHEPDPISDLGRFDVMNLSIEAMQGVLTRYRFAGNRPDVVVRVPKDAARSLEFHRAAELVDLGRTLTEVALDRAGWLDPT